MELDRRKEYALSWADANWEKVEEMMKKEGEESRAAMHQIHQKYMQAAAEQQRAASSGDLSGLGNAYPFNIPPLR